MDLSKIGETSPVRDLALVNTITMEQQAYHPVSFSTMEEEFGPFHTALFVPVTSGPTPLSYEEPIETMCLDWRNLPDPMLRVPPLGLLPMVTQKVKDSTPLDMVLLVPYIPSSPWFKEFGPLIEKGRVIPLAEKTYTNNGAFHESNVSVDGMVASQVDRNPPARERDSRGRNTRKSRYNHQGNHRVPIPTGVPHHNTTKAIEGPIGEIPTSHATTWR